MDEQIQEVFFMALGIIMFLMSVTLLLGYERNFYSAYENLYRLTESEYVMPD